MNTKALVVNHHIFLNREQRYQLQKTDSVVNVIGISSPIWVKNGKFVNSVVEVFCEYEIKHLSKEEKNTVKLSEKGFILNLTDKMPSYLLDIKDGGIECLMVSHKNSIKKDNKHVPVLHCISIEDEKTLNKTIFESDLSPI